MTEQFLIRKGGYFYRPNAQGYTSNPSEAGRYSREEAEKLTHPNGPDGPRDELDYIEAPALSASNPVATELRARLGAIPEGGTGLFLPIEEIAAIADALDFQHEKIREMAGTVDNAFEARDEAFRNAELMDRADQLVISRMIATIKLARHFLMRPFLVPDGDKVRAYLADYIDLEGWGPMPWPQGIPSAERALHSLGYISIAGFVARSAAHNPERNPTDEKRSDDAQRPGD